MNERKEGMGGKNKRGKMNGRQEWEEIKDRKKKKERKKKKGSKKERKRRDEKKKRQQTHRRYVWLCGLRISVYT